MALFEKVGGAGGGDKNSTLPPPVSALKAKGANQSITVTFNGVPTEYEEFLGDTAYIVVLKEGSVPENPKDGVAINLDKSGAVI